MNILVLYLLSLCSVILTLTIGYFVGYKASVRFYNNNDHSRHLTASMLAEKLINKNNLLNVNITKLNSSKTNYYSTKYNEIKLSPEVKDSTNLSALAISANCANQARLNQKLSIPHFLKLSFSFISKIIPIIFIPLVLVCAIINVSSTSSIPTLLILIGLIGNTCSVLIQTIIFFFELKSTKHLSKDINSLEELNSQEKERITKLLSELCIINFYDFTRLNLKFLNLLSPDRVFKQSK